MSIRITVKNRPFSLDPGAKCVLPKSPYRATFYPTKIVCAAIEIPFPHTGPVKGFTVIQDLEKGYVKVFGETKEGRISYRLAHIENDLVLFDERTKEATKTAVLQPSFQKQAIPKLSFGCHKKQDVYQIFRRMNPEEYLPLLYQIGRGYPADEVPERGVGDLLHTIKTVIETKNRVEIIPAFHQFVMAGFESIFSPVLHDSTHSGIIQGHLNVSPHIILATLARLIEAMFVLEKEGALHLLPALPPQLHHGKFIRVPFSLGSIDIEWTKKKLRRVQLHVQKAGRVEFSLPRDMHSYRVTRSKKLPSETKFPGDVLILEKGTYTLDRFQK